MSVSAWKKAQAKKKQTDKSVHTRKCLSKEPIAKPKIYKHLAEIIVDRADN